VVATSHCRFVATYSGPEHAAVLLRTYVDCAVQQLNFTAPGVCLRQLLYVLQHLGSKLGAC
jgi:hypothetical protein